ncbi:MAG: coenzyme F420-0:L-glutamate ligase [Thaumarchaeota archaeon]|nr:coenzyme F420-0:L-glutamate ligase [Nitrososphaerota archaeon]
MGRVFIAPVRRAAPRKLSRIEVIPVPGIPEVKQGADLGVLILEALRENSLSLEEGDVVVVKQKVVSKSEGQLVRLSEVVPTPAAKKLAKREGKDAKLVEVILREAVRVVRAGHGVIITETRHGFVCANSGVDQSNVGKGLVALLPKDPDASARRIRGELEAASGKRVAVIVTDTFGRPWRIGQTDVAIGCSGIAPLVPYAGKKDKFGYHLRVTEPAVVDEIAGAAELAIGKLNGIPAALIRGVSYTRGEKKLKSIIMPPSRDLFR